MRPIHYLLFLLLSMSLLPLPGNATIIVHTVKGNVRVSIGSENKPLKQGMKISPADKVTIPEGGLLEVRNDVNNNIYTSTQSGTFTISRMMLNSKNSADNNFSNINSRLRFGGTNPDKGQRVFVEQGMVKRSLAEYDPQASMLSIDPLTLARCIRENKDAICQVDTLYATCLERSQDGALAIEVVNTEAYPIYFNILSFENETYSLSCLGQPSGSYVLLPKQGIRRSHPDPTDESQRQLIIIANINFDVDLLLEELNKQPLANQDPVPEFPLYLYYF